MSIDTAVNSFTEDDIVQFLLDTPGFFERHAQMLCQIELTSPHNKRAVSLQERQAQMLRDKIKGLEAKMSDMLRYAQENVVIADKLERWTRAILSLDSPQDLPSVIAESLQSEFLIPQVTLKMWDVRDEFQSLTCTQNISEDAKVFAQSLQTPYCGPNTDFDVAQWLSDPEAAASLALIALRPSLVANTETMGLLVLASPDAARFHSDMGVSFLERIGALASAALLRLRSS